MPMLESKGIWLNKLSLRLASRHDVRLGDELDHAWCRSPRGGTTN